MATEELGGSRGGRAKRCDAGTRDAHRQRGGGGSEQKMGRGEGGRGGWGRTSGNERKRASAVCGRKGASTKREREEKDRNRDEERKREAGRLEAGGTTAGARRNGMRKRRRVAGSPTALRGPAGAVRGLSGANAVANSGKTRRKKKKGRCATQGDESAREAAQEAHRGEKGGKQACGGKERESARDERRRAR